MSVSAATTSLFSIACAWVALDGVELTEELERFDGCNWRKKARVVPQAHALMWLNAGGLADVDAAGRWSQAQEPELLRRVYVFPAGEPDPLGRARAQIMDEWRKGARG